MTVTEKRRIRILIAADTYIPDVNGAAVSTHRLAVGMMRRGHEVHVIASRHDAGPAYTAVEDGITVHRLRSHRAPTHPTYRLCLPWEIRADIQRVIDAHTPDVVHSQCHYMIGDAVTRAAVRRGIRLVATNHFMPENLNPYLPFPAFFQKIVAKNSWRDMNRILGRADVVTTPTRLSAEVMHANGIKHDIVPVSNGIDVTRYEAREGEQIEPEHPTVLFVGRLAVEKNVNVLIRAFAALPEALEARLVIAGDGDQRPVLEHEAEALGVAERVSFLGLVDDEELRRAYLEATVFCMPGTADLQSLVSLEAMSASTPVVLADALALPHLVQEGVNGYLFPPGDSAALAERLTKVLSLPGEARAAMGEASHALATKHDFGATLDTFEQLYRGSKLDDRVLKAPGDAESAGACR